MPDLTERERALMESWPVEAVKRVTDLEEQAAIMAETFKDVEDRLHAADALYGRCVAVAEGRVRGDLGPYLQPVLDAYAQSSHDSTGEPDG
jgi:hypothetical protein